MDTESTERVMYVDSLNVTYADSLKVGWFLAWRSAVVALVIGWGWGVVAFPLDLVYTDEWADFTGIVSGALGSFFLGVPWAVRMMLKKRFPGFRIQLVRVSE